MVTKSTEPAGAVQRGEGELKRRGGVDERAPYGGRIVIGGRTIELTAGVTQDERGRLFLLQVMLDPISHTEAELDELLESSSKGAGFGLPQRRTPSGPLRDQSIPFGAAS